MKSAVLVLAVVSALTACGGGGGGGEAAAPQAAPPQVDQPVSEVPIAQPAPTPTTPYESSNNDHNKYVGTWASGCVNEGENSSKYVVTLSIPSNAFTKIMGTLAVEGFQGKNCVGKSATLSTGIEVGYPTPVTYGANNLDRASLSAGSELTLIFVGFKDNFTTMAWDESSAMGEDTVVFKKQ